MRIVVVGGTGLIGARLVTRLAELGHEATAASPSTGVDTFTGDGLDEALRGADAVADVSTSRSFVPEDVLKFFTISTGNLLRAEATAGVGHHMVLSIVGTDRLPDNGYFRAKLAQEAAVREHAAGSPVGFTIVRATQFFEFLGTIADAATADGVVRLPPVLFQPIAADDVASTLAEVVVDPPTNGVIDLAGPEAVRLDALVRTALADADDARPVVADPEATYFGGHPSEHTLVPHGDAILGGTRFADWSRENTVTGRESKRTEG